MRRKIYLIPLDDHVERDVFVSSVARWDCLYALSGQSHVLLGDSAGVEPHERLNQLVLGRHVHVHIPPPGGHRALSHGWLLLGGAN